VALYDNTVTHQALTFMGVTTGFRLVEG
jgi:hypothetical protein